VKKGNLLGPENHGAFFQCSPLQMETIHGFNVEKGNLLGPENPRSFFPNAATANGHNGFNVKKATF